MSINNGSGIDYPKITLAGVEYTLKFSRGTLLFRMSKEGVSLADRSDHRKSVGATVQILRMVMTPEFAGTHEELTDILLDENKIGEASQALNVALGKVFPSTIQGAAAAGEKQALQ